ETVQRDRLIDREDRRKLAHGDFHQFLRGAQGLARFGGDEDDRLADVLRDLLDQDLLVLDHRADVVVTRDIGVREDRGDARDFARGLDVDRDDFAVRYRAPDRVAEDFVARRRNVVDEDRLAADMPGGGI